MRKLVFLFLALLLSAPVYAEPPSDASIDTLLSLSKSQQILNELRDAVKQGQLANMNAMLNNNPYITQEQKNELGAIILKFISDLDGSMSWNEIHPLYLAIYRENFSQDEIDSLIAFYQTPTGQLMLNKVPNVMRAAMQAQQVRTKPILENYQKALKQWMEQCAAADEASKSQPNSPAPAPAIVCPMKSKPPAVP